MKRLALPLFLTLAPGLASAAEYTSVYTKFDLDKTCGKIEAGDEYVFAGTWLCPGHGGYDIQISTGDDRDFVGIGAKAREALI